MANILYVDSDPGFQSMIAKALKVRLGLAVEVASSGNEAIRLITHGAHFDIVVADYEMSDGSGAELFEFLVRNKVFSLFFLFTNHQLNAELLGNFQAQIFQGVIRKTTVTNLCAAIIFSMENCSYWGSDLA